MSLERTWTAAKSYDELVKAVAMLHDRGIPGDIAEFGTMLGNTAAGLATGLSLVESVYQDEQMIEMSKQRKLMLFDSFEGLPVATAAADLISPPVISGAWAPGTCFGLTPAQLLEKCTKHLSADRIVIKEGWFENTIPTLTKDSSFALIHIDCDLYSSTMDVLDGLLGRGLLETGALIYFDDWDCNAARPDLGERKAWTDAVEKYNVEFSYSHSYAATGQAIIFHSCAASS